MSMKYIRGYYLVPAYRGARIEFMGCPCTILGSRGPYLRVRDLRGQKYTIHPTWEAVYLPRETSNV
jgi:hypothetical protein